MLSIKLPDATYTQQLGKNLADILSPATRLIIYLYGDLGAGKTSFVRAVLQGLGCSERVKSPTYTLVEPYNINNYAIYHFDLYRLADAAALRSLDLPDYFSEQAICFIEWPEHGYGQLAPADLALRFVIQDQDNGRLCEITAHTKIGQELINILDLNLKLD